MTKEPTKTACRIYGIKNCNSMKKAFLWCDDHGMAYTFHDYKKQGAPREKLLEWCGKVGWKSLINTRGPTWRKLTPEQQDISTQNQAIAIMLENSSVIRRPLVETDAGALLIGFDLVIFESSLL